MKKYILYLFALAICITGCNNGDDFGDALYVTGTLTSSNLRLLVDGQSSMGGVTVTSTAKVDADVKITLKAAPEYLMHLMHLRGGVIVSCHPMVAIQ